MAVFAGSSTTLTVNGDYYGLGHNGKKYVFRELTIVLSSQGGATNNIPAVQIGFTFIAGCASAVKSDNSAILPCSPSANGTLLLFGGGASNAPADTTGTYNITVWGRTY